jgi:DnaK suppressor protein
VTVQERTSLLESHALLVEQRAALCAHLTQLTHDMTVLIEASRDSNADDEHDPEGQTIAFERAQLSAMTDQTREHLQEVDAAIERIAVERMGCAKCVARRSTRPACRQDRPHGPASGTSLPGVAPRRDAVLDD